MDSYSQSYHFYAPSPSMPCNYSNYNTPSTSYCSCCYSPTPYYHQQTPTTFLFSPPTSPFIPQITQVRLTIFKLSLHYSIEWVIQHDYFLFVDIHELIFYCFRFLHHQFQLHNHPQKLHDYSIQIKIVISWMNYLNEHLIQMVHHFFYP